MKVLKTMAMGLLLGVLFTQTAGADLVSMRNKGSHWKIVLDYTGGISHYEMGFAYGRALAEHFPDLPARIDSYLSQTLTQEYAELCISRFASLDVPEVYVQELNGISDAMELADKSRLGDGKLSRVEFFLNNYLADVAPPTECSGLAVWGEHTAEGRVLVGRNLDLHTPGRAVLGAANAVVVAKNGEQSCCRIGYTAFMPVLTAFKPNGLFVAALDSGLTRPRARQDDPANPILVPARHKEVRSSWLYALRYAVENFQTVSAVADYMTSRSYHWNHNILIADRTRAVVVENNISGPEGWSGGPVVRDVTSELNYGVEPWALADSISVVNSFIANGNFDNHTNALRNVRRRHNQLTLLSRKSADGRVNIRDMIAIQSWYQGDKPGSIAQGDIFNRDWRVYTAQSMVFCPNTLELRVYFDTGGPEAGLPTAPDYETVAVDF